jgi:putative FmdB family regulatory protein
MMPLYEYRCRECGHRFEVLQRLGQGADGLECPHCGAPGVEKQFSTFSATGGESARTSSPGAGSGCGARAGFT